MDETDEIKHRIDIVDLVSSYLTLKKAGANYRALCPFHQEKTPSFMVSPEKQIWHCFGCNEGGDIFTFVMKMENLEFREALEMLSQRAGVVLKRSSVALAKENKPDRKSRLFKINALAAQVFNKILISHPAGKTALEYLAKRKISSQTIKEFMLGYAPSSRALKSFLLKKGFTEQEIQSAGSPDKFYRRIIFPIRDVMGNVLGFTGRAISPDQEPKYLNTPETIIFHKGRLLYNLDKARGEIKQKKNTIVVEGQMDVISSFQAGAKNVVASSGTALTPDHLQTLYRYTPNITFAFDADTAGLATAKKAYEMALVQGFNVKMTDLGTFKDPGEMIEKEPALWQKAVEKAGPVIDWYFGQAFRVKGGAFRTEELTSQEKKEIAKEILPVIKKIPDSIEQAHYVGLLAKRLEVPEKIVFEAMLKEKSNQTVRPAAPEGAKKISAAELFLGILLKKPEKIKEVCSKIKDSDLGEIQLAAIYRELLKCYNQNEDNVLAAVCCKVGRELRMKIDELILIVDNLNRDDDKLEEDFQAVVKLLESNRQEALKSYYAEEIKKAESAKDYERLKGLIKEFQDAIAK